MPTNTITPTQTWHDYLNSINAVARDCLLENLGGDHYDGFKIGCRVRMLEPEDSQQFDDCIISKFKELDEDGTPIIYLCVRSETRMSRNLQCELSGCRGIHWNAPITKIALWKEIKATMIPNPICETCHSNITSGIALVVSRRGKNTGFQFYCCSGCLVDKND